MILKSGNEIVDAIEQISLTGNVIPHLWFKHLKHESGKPNLVAIILLADVIYWYRPTIIREESTGEISKIKTKFKSDKLQKSYQSLADYFGFTKRQVKDSIKYLEDMMLITREFRTLTVEGVAMNNVLFLEPIPENIKRITFESQTYDVVTSQGCRSNVTDMTVQRQTNTKITTKITTKNLVVVDDVQEATNFYINNFGFPSEFIRQSIEDWCNTLSAEMLIEAMKISLKRNNRTFGYTEGILKNWLNQNCKSLDDVKALELEQKQRNRKHYSNSDEAPRDRNRLRRDLMLRNNDSKQTPEEENPAEKERLRSELEAKLKNMKKESKRGEC